MPARTRDLLYGKRTRHWHGRSRFGHRAKAAWLRLFRADFSRGHRPYFRPASAWQDGGEPLRSRDAQRHGYPAPRGVHARAPDRRRAQCLHLADEPLRARSLLRSRRALSRHGGGHLLAARPEAPDEEQLRGRDREIRRAVPREESRGHPLHGLRSRRRECLRPLGDGPARHRGVDPRARCRQRGGARLPLRRALFAGDAFRGARRDAVFREKRPRDFRSAAGNGDRVVPVSRRRSG